MNKEKILKKVKTKIAISNLKEENVVMKEKFNIADNQINLERTC